MRAKMKEWIRIETCKKLGYSPKKFDEVYYYFEKVIFFELDNKKIGGLDESLSIAFKKIAFEKLDREDAVTYFPMIWGNFEPFVKKVVYFVDKKTYKKLTSKEGTSVVEYLKHIGFPVFLPKQEQNVISDII